MTDTDPTKAERLLLAHDYATKLGEICVGMANVKRQVLYARGRPENDAEHSFHLGLSAVELAATFHPELNPGLVAQFSNVHDLAEVYAGDVPSHKLTKEQRELKEANEAAAVERLLIELPPHTADLLRRYEEQQEPEARFVRFVDKMLPVIMHVQVPIENKEVLEREYGYKTEADVLAGREERTQMLREMFPEFDFIYELREALSATQRQRLFAPE